MKVEKLVVGLYQENCYFIIKENKCLIVDPGDEIDKILLKIKNKNLDLVAILITHAHFDHVGALNDLTQKYNVPVYYNNVNNEINYEKIINVKEEKYNIGSFSFEVIFTSGHRNDLVTYYFYDDNIMFTGDFLFKLSIGRTDLEYASYDEMLKSIDKIKKYNDNIVIYPGHGDKTILGFEKENNMFLN